MTTDFDFSVHVIVSSNGSLGFHNLAPLLDDLNKQWVYVDAQRSSLLPPAAGPEIALIDIAVSAGGGIAGKAVWDLFFSKIASAAGERIQRRLVDLIRKAPNEAAPDRPPLSFTEGSVRFFILEELSMDEIQQCVTQAREAGRQIPESQFLKHPEPGGGPDAYYWKGDSGVWLPYGSRDEHVS